MSTQARYRRRYQIWRFLDHITGKGIPAVRFTNQRNKIINNILIVEFNEIGILMDKRFLNKDNMNDVKYVKTITQKAKNKEVPILGITGTGGAGKSSLVDELVRRFLNQYENIKIGIISVDPSKRKIDFSKKIFFRLKR